MTTTGVAVTLPAPSCDEEDRLSLITLESPFIVWDTAMKNVACARNIRLMLVSDDFCTNDKFLIDTILESLHSDRCAVFIESKSRHASWSVKVIHCLISNKLISQVSFIGNACFHFYAV
jgi:hypothetical protein